jgi:hypothetical protein
MWFFFYWPAALAAFMFGSDISRGIGGSNGRWVSFLQSVESAYSYRSQSPYHAPQQVLSPRTRIRERRESLYFAGSDRNAVSQKMYLGFICGLLKFGSGTIVSIVLGMDPVLLKGWRHFASFTIALLCVQATPKDVFFKVLSAPDVRGLVVRCVVYMACALYKLRKLTFVVHMTRNIGYGSPVTLLLSVLELEGSGVLRRFENHIMHVRWSWEGIQHVLVTNAWHLVSATNFWLSVLASCVLYMGANVDDASPFLYPLKWWSTLVALGVLSVRYNRNTTKELLRRWWRWWAVPVTSTIAATSGSAPRSKHDPNLKTPTRRRKKNKRKKT